MESSIVKPGKGGAFVRTKMKNVRSGKVVDKTFNAGTKIDFAVVDRRDYTFLYQDGADYVFMDQTDYDQVTVPGTVGGDAANFMLSNQAVTIAMHDGEPLYVDLPASVVLKSPTPSQVFKVTVRLVGQNQQHWNWIRDSGAPLC